MRSKYYTIDAYNIQAGIREVVHESDYLFPTLIKWWKLATDMRYAHPVLTVR